MRRTCIYCGAEKEDDLFSDEHIWPDALGGDFLEEFWRTNDVCRGCNSASGVFVDGAFIKSWIGNSERSSDAREYLQIEPGDVGRLPLDYLGLVKDPAPPPDTAIDYWAGPCGANIIHIRPANEEGIWDVYAGGDPRAKKNRAGWAYLLLTSHAPFWISVSLASFGTHFSRAKKRIVTGGLTEAYLKPHGIEPFDDTANPEHTVFIKKFQTLVDSGQRLKTRLAVDSHIGSRMLCKVALAVGCRIFGNDFSQGGYGQQLRLAFREANPEKRAVIPVRGTGFLGRWSSTLDAESLAWRGGWVLLILETHNQELVLSVISPRGKFASVMITDDPRLVSRTNGAYQDGVVWLTIPVAKVAADTIPLPDYLAHQTGIKTHLKLGELEKLRRDPNLLPVCG